MGSSDYRRVFGFSKIPVVFVSKFDNVMFCLISVLPKYFLWPRFHFFTKSVFSVIDDIMEISERKSIGSIPKGLNLYIKILHSFLDKFQYYKICGSFGISIVRFCQSIMISSNRVKSHGFPCFRKGYKHIFNKSDKKHNKIETIRSVHSFYLSGMHSSFNDSFKPIAEPNKTNMFMRIGYCHLGYLFESVYNIFIIHLSQMDISERNRKMFIFENWFRQYKQLVKSKISRFISFKISF